LQYFNSCFRHARSVPETVNAVVDNHVIDFPHPFTAQIVVVTSDERVLLTHRSAKVHWYPGTWSCSIEETMTLEDVEAGGNSSASLRVLVVRGLHEELGLVDRADYYAEDDARILSVFLEASETVVSLHRAVVVKLRIGAVALEARLRDPTTRKDDEMRQWRIATRADLFAYLRAPSTEYFHPTSRYRMLMFLLHAMGHERVRNAMTGRAPRVHDPLNLHDDADDADDSRR
jgi:isopentenyldiphosphate isomerase